MKKIVLYTMDRCPYCKNAKELLKKRGFTYEEILLSMDDDAAWDALTLKSGMKTVPVIYAGDQLIGGFTDLKRQDDLDRLESLK
jgi:glutaredoxin 3